MGKRECETCVRRKTEFCPPSYQCFSTDSKPFYQDRIMLLKDNSDLVSQYRYVEELREENHELKEKIQGQLSSNTLQLEAQQKEFIKYLTSTIEELECDDFDDERMKELLLQNIITYKEILSKYKEITGDKE